MELIHCTRRASARFVVGFPLLSSISACDVLKADRLGIVNRSGSRLTDVHVTFANKELALGDIDQGQSITTKHRASDEGMISVDYVQKGKRVHRDVIYISPRPHRLSRYDMRNGIK